MPQQRNKWKTQKSTNKEKRKTNPKQAWWWLYAKVVQQIPLKSRRRFQVGKLKLGQQFHLMATRLWQPGRILGLFFSQYFQRVSTLTRSWTSIIRDSFQTPPTTENENRMEEKWKRPTRKCTSIRQRRSMAIAFVVCNWRRSVNSICDVRFTRPSFFFVFFLQHSQIEQMESGQIYS